MLSVDTKKISSEVNNLDKYIREYRNNSYDIYNEISKLSSYWKDKNETIFEDKIVKQKESNLLILEKLESISSFYKIVEDIYNK